MIEKYRNFPLPSPLSIIVDWREKDKMNLTGLDCEAYLGNFKGIKCESEWI